MISLNRNKPHYNIRTLEATLLVVSPASVLWYFLPRVHPLFYVIYSRMVSEASARGESQSALAFCGNPIPFLVIILGLGICSRQDNTSSFIGSCWVRMWCMELSSHPAALRWMRQRANRPSEDGRVDQWKGPGSFMTLSSSSVNNPWRHLPWILCSVRQQIFFQVLGWSFLFLAAGDILTDTLC